MIISYTHRFIFIKPRKTAGSTVELALSPFLAPGDIATPLEPGEEPLRRVAPGVVVAMVPRRGVWPPGRPLRDHAPLARVLAHVDGIDGYRVVSMCRNPWDRAVSAFFWWLRRSDIRSRPEAEQVQAFRAFTRRWGPASWLDRVWGRKRNRALDSTPLYTVAGQPRVDFAIRYERLADDLAALGPWLGLEGVPRLGGLAAKSGVRPEGARGWAAFYDEATRELVARACAREIALFGYDFEGLAEPRGPVLSRP